jgi:flagellar hook protein FlgE
VDENGFVIASYNNGQSLRLFKVPLADFANPDGLAAITGNVFSETEVAGTVNLRQASESGVGEIVSGALEASNSELSEQLTNMIVAQRAYQANTKVISTADDLLEELNRI